MTRTKSNLYPVETCLSEVLMLFRIAIIAFASTLALTTACTNKKVSNPLAKVDSKQPDKVLFDRGMDAMKHNRFEVARLSMQTLINTYPDSEYIARAKLALADSWYAEGGTAGLAQAEQEYKDFETFFPNMPEAAEAQLKIANIHFSQMEKPDRDYTHAVRAEQEYRQVILQYPDNQKMVAEAKKKLLEVQEVIAEREFRVGRFYYIKGTYPAAIARLQSLADRYPLYSKADETLYLLGQSYENESGLVQHMGSLERAQMEKQHKVNEAQLKRDDLARERMVSEFTQKAAEAYSKILTRYPVMLRSDDAKARLIALHQPVPRPTMAMLAQNKAEEDSRREQSMISSAMGTLSKHPDVSAATTVGEPSLQDQDLIDAKQWVQRVNELASGTKTAEHSVSVVATGTDKPAENERAPRSDDPAAQSQPETSNDAKAQSATDATETNPNAATAQPDPNELKPNVAAGSASSTAQAAADDPNELKPNVPQDPQPAQAPQQVNEIAQGTNGGAQASDGKNAASGQELADDQTIASSKHKKKKGLKKVIPFQ
jgi:outer membrane protein assembly factor BamD